MLFNPIESEFYVKWMKLPMKVDTRMGVSSNSHAASEAIFQALKIRKLNNLLKTYTEEEIQRVGNIHVHVKYGSQEAKLVLVVIQGDGPTYLGHNWLKYIKLDTYKIAVNRCTKTEL